MERKTFEVRFEGKVRGIWILVLEQSLGSIFSMGFEKKEVRWLLERLGKQLRWRASWISTENTKERQGFI